MSNTFNVTSPFDGAVIATLEKTNAASAEAAMARAFALYKDRSGWLDAPTRIAVLERFVELASARTEELAKQAAH
jgi:acyl-CoA reductase-like NAD-dependent aldehyde dehydrogenase